MFEFCRFEIYYRLRHVSTYVFLSLLVAITVFMVAAAGGLISGDLVTVGGSAVRIALNSPFEIYTFSHVVFMFSIFIMASFIGQMFSKDFESRFGDILFTQPIKTYQYMFGRYLGNTILMSVIFMLAMLTYELSIRFLPGIHPDYIAEVELMWYVKPFLVLVLPNYLFIGALFIASVVMFRRSSLVFGVAFFLYLLSVIASLVSEDIGSKAFSMLLDPFGSLAMYGIAEKWSATDYLTLNMSTPLNMVLNRVIWLVVSFGMLLYSIKRYSLQTGKKRFSEESKTGVAHLEETEFVSTLPERVSPAIVDSFRTLSIQLLEGITFYLRYIFSSASVYWVSILGVCFLVLGITHAGMISSTKTLPVTYLVADAMSGSFTLLVCLIMTFYSGELVFMSRERNFHLIEDSCPTHSMTTYLSKICAMCVLLVYYLVLMIVTGIVYQSVRGYYHFELGVYVRILFLVHFPTYIMFLILVFFIHNAVNHKYLSHFIFILFVVGRSRLRAMGMQEVDMINGFGTMWHNLLFPFGRPELLYTDMTGFGANVVAYIWFSLYWFLVSLLFAGMTVLGLRSGVEQRGFWSIFRWSGLRGILRFFVVVLLLLVMTAGYIFYNTNILNRYLPPKEYDKAKADYERDFKHFQRQAQPKITEIGLKIDLYPENRELYVAGRYLLENKSESVIDTVLVHFGSDFERTDIVFSKHVNMLRVDDILGLCVYQLETGMLPGDTLSLDFAFSEVPTGFTNSGVGQNIQRNGSFYSSDRFPSIGYNRDFELTSGKKRIKNGLVEYRQEWGLPQNYLTRDADWIAFRAEVSTSAEQIALLPGQLVEQYTSGDRSYYTYEMNSHMLAFYTILSAQYEILHNKFEEVDLWIYYHKGHSYNVERMMDSMQRSVAYFVEHFGEYPFRELRIAEFPRYGAYAQAFATLIPFSESVGFIADVGEGDIDYPYWVTAHETAHQWWGHQVIGNRSRGSAMLIESFAEYSAGLVYKDKYGEAMYRKSLKNALDVYYRQRTKAKEVEDALAEVWYQPYVYYQKGLLVLDATDKLLGEDDSGNERVLNKALREFYLKYRFCDPPYPSAGDFMGILGGYVDDSKRATINDMYYKAISW